ncbi:hypothetical protein P8452_48640 [Trifolium repens]|nr:hypothetical protein P8452_48640 [Trifolium repens]
MEWTWEENLLLKYLDEEMIEGQLDKLAALVPERSTNEAKEYNQMIDEDQFEVPTYSSKDNVPIDENKAPLLKNKINKVFHWKEEEHRLFLEGLEKYGKGRWKVISKHIGTKTSTQVASHAQKHFIRINQQSVDSTKKSKRRSKFDTTLWNGDFHPLLYRDYIPPLPNFETQPIVV